MPSTRAVHHWTTTNLGEAAPGVLTPLSWALWGEPGERAARRAAFEIGALRQDELNPPEDPADWILRLFHGRLAMQLEFMALMGDRAPGTTGRDAIRGMFGEAPPGMEFNPTRERYASIAWRFPRAFVTFPRRLRALAADQDCFWRMSVARVADLELPEALALFEQGRDRFEHSSGTQLLGTLCSVQPLYDAVDAVIKQAGTGEIGVLSGAGGAETAVVGDIWRASRGEIEIRDIVAAHGFHGPGEGELSSTVWREDSTPLQRLAEQYAQRDDGEDPRLAEAGRAEELRTMQAAVLAGLPAVKRPAVRLLLALAAERIPQRGVAKRAFLQAIDVSRAAARRAGELLVADGRIDGRDDVFLLAGDELLAVRDGRELRELVAARRERRAECERMRFASTEWFGLPETTVEEEVAPELDAGGVLTGIGVSSGVAEGVVRVVTDPSFADVEPDEILVAPTTDPSWSSIMFISSALVVDLGGALSHAAVVARELRIPCVVGTRDGTRALSTGDRVRVDGAAGTVELLERAAAV